MAECETGGLSGVYRERASRLRGAVLWTTAARPAGGAVLPDGCTDLIWGGGRLLVSGPDTGPHLAEGTPGTRFTGLRFAPGQGPAVFGVPAGELRDRRVPLEDLWPAGRVRELTGRLAADGAPGRLLEEAAVARIREAAGHLPPGRAGRSARSAAITRALAQGRSVTEVADGVQLGVRQLHRHCLDAFGYGPKTLARVLRLVRALDLARAGVPYVQVADRAGYADQAHLAREVRSLAGVPLGALLGPG
ncbi:helix-turn-helix transcriptional regulator [Streptomyces pinistramenti]|uniref:helix-turn-helix transcriptional regulator n=1 Tax=Streptomyces pinistramenti TaxID=2884812 RepID=UPI001D07BB05|nr:helix-turn-helix domain-containing protein [Streptomyces pinistramenti]MCB5908737.1 helix-turn-helix domain-containing protein [Streptomyces pinistramenti]